jgi:hypothetical protein
MDDYQIIQGITVWRVHVYFVLLPYAENFMPGEFYKVEISVGRAFGSQISALVIGYIW